MKVVAIIQARMSSTRLPNKVMAEIAGAPMIEHVVRRAEQASKIDQVIVATSDQPADDRLVHYLEASQRTCFRGSEHDVLDRFTQAARRHAAEVVVRLTADCPLLDPRIIDRVIAAFLEGDFDYVGNTIPPTYPDGLDTEVFSRAALEAAWEQAAQGSEREHVTFYLYRHPEQFRLHNVRHIADLSALRWTVDEPRDLEFARAVYQHFGARMFGMEDVLQLLEDQPQIGRINTGIDRNEGLKKSLAADEARAVSKDGQ